MHAHGMVDWDEAYEWAELFDVPEWVTDEAAFADWVAMMFGGL